MAMFSIRRRSHNFEPVVFGECDAVRFQHVCNKQWRPVSSLSTDHDPQRDCLAYLVQR